MPGFTLSRRQAIVAVTLTLGVVLLASRLFAAPPEAAEVVSPPFPAPLEASAPVTPEEVVVDVAGAVRRPGVYRLEPGSRVADAIAEAGGATRRAEPAMLNLAAPLVDGQQGLMPERGTTAGTAGAGAGAAGSHGAPVSLSLATPEELETLPGVGPVTAQKIVAYRQEHGPFTSVDQLDAIAGIGPKRLESLRELVVP